MKKEFAALVVFCNDDVYNFGIEELILKHSDRSKEIMEFLLLNKIFRTNVMRSTAYRCVVLPQELFGHLLPEFWNIRSGCAVERFEIDFDEDGFVQYQRILTTFGDLFDHQDTLSPAFRQDDFFEVLKNYGVIVQDLKIPVGYKDYVVHPNPSKFDPDDGLQFEIAGRINSEGICNLFSMIAWSGIFFDNLAPNEYCYSASDEKIFYSDEEYNEHNSFPRGKIRIILNDAEGDD